MKYGITYQFADNNQRPDDPGPFEFNFESHEGSHLLPNVGDYVHIGATEVNGGPETGRVRSRLFYYQEMKDGTTWCHVNIVVERDPNMNWGLLIKQ